MVRAIIFDLDGVLADTAAIHDAALTTTLTSLDPSYCMTDTEAFEYGTIPTKDKLTRFFAKRNIVMSNAQIAALYKQKTSLTSSLLPSALKGNKSFQLIAALKHSGYLLGLCSNAGSSFVFDVLASLDLSHMFDVVLTNGHVNRSKPHPDIYLQAMLTMGVGPRDTLIFEDSFHGVKSAFDSGAHVAVVASPKELTIDWIKSEIAAIDSFKNAPSIRSDKLTVVVPMAGAGSRFEQAGYTDHKPMIPVGTDTILGLTLKSLANIDAHYLFIVQRSHYERYDLGTRLRLLKPGCEIIQIDGLTEGAACTLLAAKDSIDNDRHLIIINSDNLILWDREHLLHMLASGVDGGIVVFKDDNPKWSFAKLGDNGFVCEVAEKRAISNLATCGIYYWARGSDFVKYANQMISKNIRVNGEFYTAPVINEAIADGKSIKTYECKAMWGLGTPADLDVFKRDFRE